MTRATCPQIVTGWMTGWSSEWVTQLPFLFKLLFNMIRPYEEISWLVNHDSGEGKYLERLSLIYLLHSCFCSDVDQAIIQELQLDSVIIGNDRLELLEYWLRNMKLQIFLNTRPWGRFYAVHGRLDRQQFVSPKGMRQQPIKMMYRDGKMYSGGEGGEALSRSPNGLSEYRGNIIGLDRSIRLNYGQEHCF